METAKITAFASHFDLALDGDRTARLGAWLTLLEAWNKKLDLTAAKTENDLLDVMLADAFVLAKHVRRDAIAVDVGSGAGAPGLPLALVRPDLKMTLVEPLTKRVSFLRTALADAKRPDVIVKRARSEELERKSFDVAISRATLSPQEWLDEGAALAKDDGEIWVLLAKEEAPNRPDLREIERHSYTWPNAGHARTLVKYAR